jgi:hypothetical protein
MALSFPLRFASRNITDHSDAVDAFSRPTFLPQTERRDHLHVRERDSPTRDDGYVPAWKSSSVVLLEVRCAISVAKRSRTDFFVFTRLLKLIGFMIAVTINSPNAIQPRTIILTPYHAAFC